MSSQQQLSNMERVHVGALQHCCNPASQGYLHNPAQSARQLSTTSCPAGPAPSIEWIIRAGGMTCAALSCCTLLLLCHTGVYGVEMHALRSLQSSPHPVSCARPSCSRLWSLRPTSRYPMLPGLHGKGTLNRHADRCAVAVSQLQASLHHPKRSSAVQQRTPMTLLTA